MAKIHLTNKLVIDVPNEEAKRIQAIVDQRGSNPITTRDSKYTFKSNAVTLIILDDENSGENKFQKVYDEVERERRTMIAMSPEDRADMSLHGIAALIYCCHGQQTVRVNGYYVVSPAIREALRVDLIAFFQSNPNRCYPDIAVFEKYLQIPLNGMNPVQLSAYKSCFKTISEDRKMAEVPLKHYCPQCLEEQCVCSELHND